MADKFGHPSMQKLSLTPITTRPLPNFQSYITRLLIHLLLIFSHLVIIYLRCYLINLIKLCRRYTLLITITAVFQCYNLMLFTLCARHLNRVFKLFVCLFIRLFFYRWVLDSLFTVIGVHYSFISQLEINHQIWFCVTTDHHIRVFSFWPHAVPSFYHYLICI